MPRRRRYHSDLKIAASLGMLPAEIQHSIPASTLHRFRTSDFSDLLGLELNLNETVELIRRFAHSRRAQKVFAAYLRVKQTLIHLLSAGRSLPAALAKHKRRVVSSVERVKETLGLRRTLRLFGLTPHRYTRWRNLVQKPCMKSFLSLCFPSHPVQLSRKEVATVRRLMDEPRYYGWPAVSIYWHAVRQGVIGFARSTFYKYLNVLGLAPAKGVSRRRDHAQGIRASAPNELWHADVTVFRTADHLKAFIYLVVDNFSRRILSWAVSTELSAQTHIATVREAHDRFVAPSSEFGEASTTLITDGGAENAADSRIPVQRLIAGKDILFSNSLVESVNKIVKYQSLYLREIADITALHRHLEEFIPIYNDVRPHCAHGYLTPTEVHEGATHEPERFAEQFLAARKARITANRAVSCSGCEVSHEQ